MNSLAVNNLMSSENDRSKAGFTLLETACALLIMMVVTLGAASLFAFSTTANQAANERELAIAVAQKRLEFLRTIPFTVTNRSLAYSYPNGGLAATAATGVAETAICAGRTYSVKTVITDTDFVPTGKPDAGAPIEKRITVTVTPIAGSPLGAVTVSTLRSTLVAGSY